MTAKSSQYLANTLRAAGPAFEGLAMRAEKDEFHDFLSPLDMPSIELDKALVGIIIAYGYTSPARAATELRKRHHNGDFDATPAESEEWAKSPDGQATFNALIEDFKKDDPTDD